MVITAVTYILFPKHFVFFGTLHCIAAASVAGVFFADKPRLSLLLGLILVASNLILDPTLIPFSDWLNVSPMDYIPFYPWVGVILFGIYLESKRLHKVSFTRSRLVKATELLGRHSLKIYLIHRPVLFGTLFLIYTLKT